MKKLLILVTAGILAISLTACAKKMETEKTRVKCPACGYEFEVPAGGGR